MEALPAPAEATEAKVERQRKIKAAMAWLREQMADGQPRRAGEMEVLAREAGIAKRTLTLARQRLAIRSERQGTTWVWIPPTRTRKKQPLAP